MTTLVSVSTSADESRDATRSARRAVAIPAAIFCGGRSTRMGRDKALLSDSRGATLLARARRLVEPLASCVVLACGPTPRYEELGLACCRDLREGAGPLGGLEAVLAELDEPRVLVLACDMPLVGVELLETLVARAQEEDLDVCLLGTPAGLEPLCAVYSRACLAPVREALDAGERRMTSFLGRTVVEPLDGTRRALRVAVETCADPEAVRNLNTPSEWERFLRLDR